MERQQSWQVRDTEAWGHALSVPVEVFDRAQRVGQHPKQPRQHAVIHAVVARAGPDVDHVQLPPPGPVEELVRGGAFPRARVPHKQGEAEVADGLWLRHGLLVLRRRVRVAVPTSPVGPPRVTTAGTAAALGHAPPRRSVTLGVSFTRGRRAARGTTQPGGRGDGSQGVGHVLRDATAHARARAAGERRAVGSADPLYGRPLGARGAVHPAQVGDCPRQPGAGAASAAAVRQIEPGAAGTPGAVVGGGQRPLLDHGGQPRRHRHDGIAPLAARAHFVQLRAATAIRDGDSSPG